jgi:SagB-type dehydrogenase family enzyme
MERSRGSAARAYHQASKHSEQSLRRNRHYLDFQNQPLAFKIYTGLESQPLIREWVPQELPALDALRLGTQRIQIDQPPLDRSTLSRVLYLSAGITKRKRVPGGEMYFRAASNTGALYHIDLYLVCAELPDLAAGVYHFAPNDFALHQLRTGDQRAILVEATGSEPAIAHATAILVSASTYWRNAWKYQSRAYRHCYWDSGTLHANLLAAATMEQLPVQIVMGFADGAVEQLLGLDPEREAALTLVALGRTQAPAETVSKPPNLSLETERLSKTEVDYPAIREIHAASSLAIGAEAASWRQIAPAKTPPTAAGRLFPLSPAADSDLPRESLESVIRRRGSTRIFNSGASISLAQLATVLDRASSPLPTDFTGHEPDSRIDLYLIVHAVEGLAPGTYFYHPEQAALELLREGDFRDAAGRLGLSQDLPADAAVNVYCVVDLERVFEDLGDRGYRCAQLEGGIRGGLMYLAAYAQRFGATGLTFLDDEVIELFSPHAEGKSVMFLTALGRSAR